MKNVGGFFVILNIGRLVEMDYCTSLENWRSLETRGFESHTFLKDMVSVDEW